MPSASRTPSVRQLSYLDFELEIGPGKGREYPVAVIRSPAGEAQETMHFPYDELALQNRLKDLQIALLRSGGKRRQLLSPEEQSVQDFGRDLFDALLSGEVRSRYDVSRERAAAQDKGLRLKLRIQPPELAALPWEYLYDPRQAEYLCLSRNTPIVRYLEIPQPIQPLTVTPPLRILGMVACPRDLGRLDLAREKQRVDEAIKDLRVRGLVDLQWLPGQTWRHLQRAMRRGPWHILHFIGHGGFDRNADQGFIALADDAGLTDRLEATKLGRLLADHRSLRLALLNSCEGARGSERDIFSSTASILVRRGIPAVLAMQDEITDRAAIEFARAFYEALADGMAVDAAVAEARKAVSLSVTNTVEWGTPVLYMRSPDGILFNVQETEAARRASEEAVREAREEAERLERERREHEAAEKAEPVPREGAAGRLLGLPPFFWVALVALLAFSAVLVGPKVWSVLRPPPQAGATRVLEPADIVMVYVPAGEFLMGSTEAQVEEAFRMCQEMRTDCHRYWFDAEMQQHRVYLDGYWVGRTEVTNAQFRKFIEAGGYSKREYWTAEGWQWKESAGITQPHSWNDPTWNKPDHPVVGVSWYEAAAYAKWAGARLPTEAEWEKAARGTDGRIWPWGNEFDCAGGNFDDSYTGCSDGCEYTAPAGSYPYGASPCGCLDMAGNVSEWVADWHGLYERPTASNPTGPASGDYRVVRGGDWNYNQAYARCAWRGVVDPGDRFADVGFRVAE